MGTGCSVSVFYVPGDHRNHRSPPCDLLFGVAGAHLTPMRIFHQCFYKVGICKAALVDPLEVRRAEKWHDPPAPLPLPPNHTHTLISGLNMR